MQKVTRGDVVAVLITRGYGSGWSTSNKEHPEILFDPATIAWVEGGKKGKGALSADLKARFKGIWLGGLDNLTVAWVPAGVPFEIAEYDGTESIRYRDQINWRIA